MGEFRADDLLKRQICINMQSASGSDQFAMRLYTVRKGFKDCCQARLIATLVTDSYRD